MRSTFRVLGIDPGFDRTGFGIIDQVSGNASWVHHSCLQTSAKNSFEQRLLETRDGVSAIIKQFQPHVAIVESLFFQTNVKTAIKVGMARGAIFVAIADAGIPIFEITPNQVKQGITGWGAAGKDAIGQMVVRMLKLKEIPKPDDAADALAIAIVGGLYARVQAANLRSVK